MNKSTIILATLAVFVIAVSVGISVWQFNLLKETKRGMQLTIDQLSQQNAALSDELETARQGIKKLKTDLSSLEDALRPIINASLDTAGKNAQIASIKSSMEYIVPSAIICSDGGVIQSGSGGSALCSSSNSEAWPTIDICGIGSDDTHWTVFNGISSDWDVTLTCKNAPECNGPDNAICNSDGCNFKNTCQMRQQ